MVKLGKRLREARIAAGFTQREVARRLDVDQSRISRMESGKRGIKVGELIELVSLYDMTIDTFLEVDKT